MSSQDRRGFWREAFALHGSITPHVVPHVLSFGVIATVVCLVAWLVERLLQVRISLEVAPFEFAGAALGLLLILRTNIPALGLTSQTVPSACLGELNLS